MLWVVVVMAMGVGGGAWWQLLKPDLNPLSRKTTATVPSFDHRRGNSSHTRGPIRGPLSIMIMWCLCFTRSFGCSLSWWRKVGLPSALWQKSGPNFKGLPKVSGVATNHWVSLRCDQSSISS